MEYKKTACCHWSARAGQRVQHLHLDIVYLMLPGKKSRWQTKINAVYGCFPKWWVSPTTMGFPTKNDHFGVFWGYHHSRKHPYICQCIDCMPSAKQSDDLTTSDFAHDCLSAIFMLIYCIICHIWPFMTIPFIKLQYWAYFTFHIIYGPSKKKHIQLGIQPYKNYVDVPSSVWGPSGVFEIMGYTPEI